MGRAPDVQPIDVLHRQGSTADRRQGVTKARSTFQRCALRHAETVSLHHPRKDIIMSCRTVISLSASVIVGVVASGFLDDNGNENCHRPWVLGTGAFLCQLSRNVWGNTVGDIASTVR